MATDQGPATDDYRVGYGRPPKHSQFKKGHSGNPKGRPKASRSLKTELRDTLATTIPVTIDGRKRRITMQRAMVMAMAKQALSSPLTFTRLIDIMIKVGVPFGDDEMVDALSKSDQEIIDSYVERRNEGGSND